MKTCQITFLPDNKKSTVAKGITLLDAAQQADIYISSVCGGNGTCGKCRVILKKGRVKSESTGPLSPDEMARGIVLACQAKVIEDIEVEIPPESRIEETEVLLTAQRGIDIQTEIEKLKTSEATVFPHSPLATKIHLKLQPDDTLEHLSRELRNKTTPFDLQIESIDTNKIETLLKENNREVTVTLGKRDNTAELILIEPGNTSATNYGLAVDIGTTTVVTYLIDLVSRKTLGAVGSFNKQIAYGDDIITRIIFAGEKDGLKKLHQAVTENINEHISVLTRKHSIKLEDIMAVLCAGNTTMVHLLLNMDPGYIRRQSDVPAVKKTPIKRAAEVGIKINHQGWLACAPSVANYVGGDITAGLLTCGMYQKDELSLYLDMGTNGEMVLGNKDWLTCCACSIGPAFEGSGIKSGTRAIKGAIQKLKINPPASSAGKPDYTTQVSTIGNTQPLGICGSGLIELLSEMLETGLINRAGKINPDLKTPRVKKGEAGLEFILVPEEESGTGRDIVITQPDLDNLIRSKGAVFASVQTLLKKLNYTFKDVNKFYIAGAFGSHLDIPKAIKIGLLPDLAPEKFQYVGNGSVAGAMMTLLSCGAMKNVQQIADKMTYIELSGDNIFHEEFIAALFLPHTDLSLFPSYPKR